MQGKTPYTKCPIYTSPRFQLRLVQPDDAADLLVCYADPAAVRFMNADNCSGDFYITTLAEMQNCITAWLKDYANSFFVRFCIIDKQEGKAIGTIEMYDKTEKLAILRLDLAAAYEESSHICEILGLVTENFYTDFAVSHMLTKAIPAAAERITALHACGFTSAADDLALLRGNYSVAWTWQDGQQKRARSSAAILRSDYFLRPQN
jgi:RimJ/RimL family protein N-acetyltransferase